MEMHWRECHFAMNGLRKSRDIASRVFEHSLKVNGCTCVTKRVNRGADFMCSEH